MRNQIRANEPHDFDPIPEGFSYAGLCDGCGGKEDDMLHRYPEKTPRYTLDEARRLLAAEECGITGHNFEVLKLTDGSPLMVICIRVCGAGPWNVVANPKRKIEIQNTEPTP